MRQLQVHFTIQDQISLRLLGGLLISIVCLWLFAQIAEEIVRGQTFNHVDLVVAKELRTVISRSALRFFRIVSMFGYQGIMILGIAVGLYLIVRGQWLRLGVWLCALGGGATLNMLLKAWFAHPRPMVSQPQIVALYYGFPSGHALMSLITYGLLAYFLFVTLPRAWQRVLVVSSLILFILFIGFSRIYLGVHYSSDVLAGFVVGCMWLSFCITMMNFLLGKQGKITMLLNYLKTSVP